MSIRIGRENCRDLSGLETREWLVTNGIGGYASGSDYGYYVDACIFPYLLHPGAFPGQRFAPAPSIENQTKLTALRRFSGLDRSDWL